MNSVNLGKWLYHSFPPCQFPLPLMTNQPPDSLRSRVWTETENTVTSDSMLKVGHFIENRIIVLLDHHALRWMICRKSEIFSQTYKIHHCRFYCYEKSNNSAYILD